LKSPQWNRLPHKVAELPKIPKKSGEIGHSPTNHQESGQKMEIIADAFDLVEKDIQGVTFVLDYSTQRAYFVDFNGKVRFQAVKDGKCTPTVSGIVRKTDKRRKPDIQARMNRIYDMLRQPGNRPLKPQMI
jgi:hypothetical protein